MDSEFEKALVAIDSMSYGERMDFAWELYQDHVITGHDAQTCVFCVGMVEIRGVCDSCHTRFVSDDNIAEIYSCYNGCNKIVMHCCRCINEHQEDGKCDGKLCKNCVMMHGVDNIACGDCQHYYDFHKEKYSKCDYNSYSYEEMMILAKKLKFMHEHNPTHIVQQCPFCDNPYAKQPVCSYCFQPDPTTIENHHSYAECLECKTPITICNDCACIHGCQYCYLTYELSQIYCVVCYKAMSETLQCECKKHYNNIYGRVIKACKT